MLNNLFRRKRRTTLEIVPSQHLSIGFPFGTINIGNAQHQGKRDYQEDSFGFSEISDDVSRQKGLLAVLADGMGGLKDGKAVSSATVSGLLNWFNQKQSIQTTGHDLMKATAEINRSICDTYCSDGKISSGTTIVEVLINDGYLHWLCVGDSRLYLKRGSGIYQINEDHDYLNQLLDSVIEKNLTAEDAFGDSQKDKLAACIGKSDLDAFDFSKKGYLLEKNDILIICSDGIYNAVTEAELFQNVTSDSMESCKRIINLVASKRIPNQDNNTIITISYT